MEVEGGDIKGEPRGTNCRIATVEQLNWLLDMMERREKRQNIRHVMNETLHSFKLNCFWGNLCCNSHNLEDNQSG